MLAILALLVARIRPLFWLLVVAFNAAGVIDTIVDYYDAIHSGLPAAAGELGDAYIIPILYVPLLMITHVTSFYLLTRSQPKLTRLWADIAASLSKATM